MKGIVNIIKVRADEKSLDFVYEPLSNFSGAVFTDETRLRQVLLNLLGNAVKFTEKGEVRFKIHETVETEIKEESDEPQYGLSRFRFEIEDTGIGIAKEKMDTIFSAFEQSGGAKNRREGTGLGLSISRKIVRLMGSEIYLKSSLGQGSAFWFEVELQTKRYRHDSLETPEKRIVGYHSDRNRPVKILVTDDNLYNRSLLHTLLTAINFEIKEAENGKESVELFNSWNPDLIFMDIAMPIMDGFQATKAIRSNPKRHSITIIAASASVSDTDRQSCLQRGFDDFLAKPINFEELFAMLEKYLNLRWKYEDELTETEELIQPENSDRLIPPSKEGLDILYERASRGNMKSLIEEAERIEISEPQTVVFIQKIKELAKEYKDREVLELIKEYYSNEG